MLIRQLVRCNELEELVADLAINSPHVEDRFEGDDVLRSVFQKSHLCAPLNLQRPYQWVTGHDPSIQYLERIGAGGHGEVFKVILASDSVETYCSCMIRRIIGCSQ